MLDSTIVVCEEAEKELSLQSKTNPTADSILKDVVDTKAYYELWRKGFDELDSINSRIVAMQTDSNKENRAMHIEKFQQHIRLYASIDSVINSH